MSKERPDTPEQVYDYFIDYMNNISTRPNRNKELWPIWDEDRCYLESEKFFDYYQSKTDKQGNWLVGKNRMRDWQAACRNWYRNGKNYEPQKPKSNGSSYREKLRQAYEQYDQRGLGYEH